MIGTGGLGSPAALYLAAAGVGTIGLVDFDTVDVSNLQRQILHTQDRIGMAKTQSAKIALNALNPDVRVVEHNEVLSSESAPRLFRQYDVIVNGCDNFPTRYLANDVAIFERKPLVDGGIFRFEGQVTTIVPFASPCYRCRYPAPPPPEEAPSCAEAGVLGVLPGIVGVLQATEVIKLILGIGSRSPAACSPSTPSTCASASSASRATPSARSAARTRPSPSRSTTRASARCPSPGPRRPPRRSPR